MKSEAVTWSGQNDNTSRSEYGYTSSNFLAFLRRSHRIIRVSTHLDKFWYLSRRINIMLCGVKWNLVVVYTSWIYFDNTFVTVFDIGVPWPLYYITVVYKIFETRFNSVSEINKNINSNSSYHKHFQKFISVIGKYKHYLDTLTSTNCLAHW